MFSGDDENELLPCELFELKPIVSYFLGFLGLVGLASAAPLG
jgi:hypothetical protein